MHRGDWRTISQAARAQFSATSEEKGTSGSWFRECQPSDVASWLITFITEFRLKRPPNLPDPPTDEQLATAAVWAIYDTNQSDSPPSVLLAQLVEEANFEGLGGEAWLNQSLTKWIKTKWIKSWEDKSDEQKLQKEVAKRLAVDNWTPEAVAHEFALDPESDKFKELHKKISDQIERQRTQFKYERAVERLLVYGAYPESNPPPGKSPYDSRWNGAKDALFHIICKQIYSAVDWIGQRVLQLDGVNLAVWQKYQVETCATHIRDALVLGRCECWKRWEELRIKSEDLAREHCQQHRLICWDKHEPLHLFLFRQAVCGPLRIPNRKKKKDRGASKANRFRQYGMLARVVTDVSEFHGKGRSLVAGQILKCADPKCTGQIQLDDHCDQCRALSNVVKPSWWIWFPGDRNGWPCRRCMNKNIVNRPGLLAAVGAWPAGRKKTAALLMYRDKRTLAEVAKDLNEDPASKQFRSFVSGIRRELQPFFCNSLFFNWRGNCPRCGHNKWSPRLTEVWLPSHWVPLDNQGGPVATGPNPAAVAEDNEMMSKLIEWINKWKEKTPEQQQEKKAGLLLYRDSCNVEEIAKELGLKPDSAEFKKLLKAIECKGEKFLTELKKKEDGQ